MARPPDQGRSQTTARSVARLSFVRLGWSIIALNLGRVGDLAVNGYKTVARRWRRPIPPRQPSQTARCHSCCGGV
jgi:hypothetical protein